MSRYGAISPIVSAFLCGYHLPDLAWRIDSGAGVRSATDLLPWLIVPIMGGWAIWGGWRAWTAARPSPK